MFGEVSYLESSLYFIVGCSILLLLHWLNRKRRLIKDTPSIRIAGITEGLVETHGICSASHPFISTIYGVECVYSMLTVDEFFRRERTERYRDSSGHWRTRIVVDSGRERVFHLERRAPFVIGDSTGKAMIIPDKLDVIAGISVSQEAHLGYDLYARCQAAPIAGSTGIRVFTERIIPVSTTVYVIGQANYNWQTNEHELRDYAGFGYISIEGEYGVALRMGMASAFYWVLGFASFYAGAYALGSFTQLSPFIEALWGVVAFAILSLACYVVRATNSIIRLKNDILRMGSNVDTELQRREDLIPNIVRLIRPSMAHEFASLATGTNTANVLFEACPDLKTSPQFKSLAAVLTTTENKIAMLREYRLGLIESYNNRLESFPEGMVLRLCGMRAFRF